MMERAISLANKRIKVINSSEEKEYLSKQNLQHFEYLVIVDNNKLPICVYVLNGNHNRDNYLNFTTFEIVDENQYINLKSYKREIFLVKDSQSIIIGIITIYEINKFLQETLESMEKEYDLIKTDLDAFMACSEDLACISDGEGSKVRISSSCERIYGVKPESLIGKNVKDLEKSGMYLPSATKLVIEEKNKLH